MTTCALAESQPSHSISPDPVAGGAEPARRFEPGDFLLSRAHGVKHDVISWGQALRLPDEDKHYAGYTHAALVVSPTGGLIEAIGEGVCRSSLKQYVIAKEVFQLVRIKASEAARRLVVEFADRVLAAKAPYAGLAIVCTTVWAFTGYRLMLCRDGTYTCSGLVATALERTGATFGMHTALVTPAQLAVTFKAPPPPSVPTRALPDRPRRRR